MTKIKVLHLIGHLECGGAQDNTLSTVQGLDRTQFEVHLASAPVGRWLPRGCQAADEFHMIRSLRQDRFDIDLFADPRALLETMVLIRAQQYDLVHTHSSKAGFIGRVAAHACRTKVVVHTIHGFPFHDHMSPFRRWSYIQLERFAARRTHYLISVCERIEAEALSLEIASPGRIVTIYSGIDLSKFKGSADSRQQKLALALQPDHLVVGFVGRLSRQKAPQDFVRAAQVVLTRVPNAQFIMVGDGPLQHEVRQLIAGDPRIRMLGYRDDIPELLNAVDIFVISSLWEGLGRSLTEAMAAGLPVVATNVNGVPEVVVEGQTGFLVPSHDPQTLADRIVYLLRNPSVRTRLGQNARDRVVPAFEAATMVQRISDLYRSLLGT